MKNQNLSKVLVGVIIISSVLSCNFKNYESILIDFKTDTSSLADSIKVLKSFKKMDNFFVLNYTGIYDDRTSLLQKWFDSHVGYKYRPTGCSVFYTSKNANQGFLAQNFDRDSDVPDIGILFGRYCPIGKYKSFSLSRIEDLQTEDMKGLTRNINPSNLTDYQRYLVLFFPFFSVGGINEHGLAIGIASIPSQLIKETENRSPIFVTHFIRQLLDNCRTIDEAIKLSKKYYIYDRSLCTITHHILIGDSTGHSVMIEYKNGKMDYVLSDQKFQLFTNKPIIDNSNENLNQCWRFKIINERLSESNANLNIQDCLSVLKKVKNNTMWTVVYDLKNKQGIFTVYGDFTKQYKFGF
jgi:hypothetical protein